MPTANSVIDRTDVGASSPRTSAARSSRNASVGRPDSPARHDEPRPARLPVLSVLPVAYWVDGDTGPQADTEQNGANST
jgi:hypothetical protein